VQEGYRRIDQRLQQILREAERESVLPTTLSRAQMASTWGLIPGGTVDEIRSLAALDEIAQHQSPGVSPEQADEYLARVQDVLNTLRERPKAES
jgi:hypothetical protein